MLEYPARFVSLFAAGIMTGLSLCVFFAERVWAGNGQFYTQLMQLWIRALSVPAMVVGGLGLLAIGTDAAVLFKRGAGAAFWLAVIAAVFGVVAFALTRFGHFPINDQIAKWDPSDPPVNWTSVQARWSALHVGRTFCSVISFALLLSSNLLRR